MKSAKYIGLGIHQSTISIAVPEANGKLMMQSVIATQSSTILDFIQGIRSKLHVTLEQGIFSTLVIRAAEAAMCTASWFVMHGKVH